MKKIISVICAVVLLLSSVSVSAFALTKSEADAEIAAQKKMFEGAFSQDITAGDARDVLLTSAGLASEKENSQFFDIDSDGKITAIDARIYLRIAAKLDNVKNHYNDIKYDYFLSLINSVKPSEYTFYESLEEEIQKVSYTDYDNVVGQMNKQLELYSSYDEEMVGYDFGAEIKSAEGDKSTSYSTLHAQTKNENNYPVKGNQLACFATLDDVEKIEHKTNQSFTFERYSAVTNAKLYGETVNGLDSITVYFKSESVSLSGNLNNVFDNLKINNAFDTLSKEDVDEMLAANSSISSIEGMEDMGTCEIKISPKSLQYKNSFITVYYNPETGVPVATVHNLHYIMSMNMYMNIDIAAKNLAGDSAALEALLTLLTLQNGGKLLKVKGSMDIANEMNVKSTVYFTGNNPSHIPY